MNAIVHYTLNDSSFAFFMYMPTKRPVLSAGHSHRSLLACGNLHDSCPDAQLGYQLPEDRPARTVWLVPAASG
jgi:hypothetical protein